MSKIYVTRLKTYRYLYRLKIVFVKGKQSQIFTFELTLKRYNYDNLSFLSFDFDQNFKNSEVASSRPQMSLLKDKNLLKIMKIENQHDVNDGKRH